jgi:hypothetical protein
VEKVCDKVVAHYSIPEGGVVELFNGLDPRLIKQSVSVVVVEHGLNRPSQAVPLVKERLDREQVTVPRQSQQGDAPGLEGLCHRLAKLVLPVHKLIANESQIFEPSKNPH